MAAFTYRAHPHAFHGLEREKYINLTTFRKSGLAVDTPVWFVEHNSTIYVETGRQTGKVKRIRRTARVFLAPCTVSGKVKTAAVEGKARVVNSVEEVYIAKGALQRKYGLARVAFDSVTLFIGLLRRRNAQEKVYLAIEPVYLA